MNANYTNEKYMNWKWKVYEWKVSELEIVENEKQPSNVFLTKRYGKCIQPNEKVVPLDSKCTWSNVNLWYGKVTIQSMTAWHERMVITHIKTTNRHNIIKSLLLRMVN